jgi:hypothetical protein
MDEGGARLAAITETGPGIHARSVPRERGNTPALLVARINRS